MPSEPHPGSIMARNKEDTIEAETLFWRALCDKPKTIRKYIADDCVMTQPDNKIYSDASEPSLKEYLDDYEAWTAYKMHDDPEFVEIDMMSSGITYRVTAWKQKGDKMIPTEALCTTVWRQGAGGDWKACLHHMTKVPK
ncbi:hypothetical protein LIA77_05817 [Sarocladium implicatum]|nr:hypothetical protein LIA77_05817 [Sarocladium implicatum]